MHTTSDTILLARFHILLTEEAPIRTIQLWGVPEALLVAFEGSFDVLLVVRVSLEHFILRNQPLGTLGEKNFVAKLHRRLHLAALDEIGVGFKDGIDLFRVGNLLSFEHPTARLVDRPVSQFAVVGDLLAEFVDGHFRDLILAAVRLLVVHYLSCMAHHFFGYVNEFADISWFVVPAVPFWASSVGFLACDVVPPACDCGTPNSLLDCFFEGPTKRVTTRTTSHNKVLSVG